ncbi:MAG: hypothetical protein QXT97_02575 [Candidatus Diapherotrites archaeon]
MFEKLEKKARQNKRFATLLKKLKEEGLTEVETLELENLLKSWGLFSSLQGLSFQSKVSKIKPSVKMVQRSTFESIEATNEIASNIIQKKPSNILYQVILVSIGKQLFTNGQKVFAEEAGLKRKMWIRTRNAKTEERAHSSLEGKIIPRDALFTLPDGSKVYAPHDWKNARNPAKEFINCGHAIIYLP